MKNKRTELELKIYEKLGVKKFKDFLVNNVIVFACEPIKYFKMPKKELKRKIQNTSRNYFMKKGNGLKDLEDFKKRIYYNTTVHIVGMIISISIMLTGGIIYGALLTLINTYCLMLQRYNYIRIDNTIKKFKDFENKKITQLKEEIKENTEDHQIVQLIIDKNKNVRFEKNKINIDEFLNLISLDDLKILRNKLIKLQILNERHLTNSFHKKNESYSMRAKVKKKI